MCASKKESLVTLVQIGAVIDNLKSFIGEKNKGYIEILFDSSVALLNSSKGDVENMVKVVDSMKFVFLIYPSTIDLDGVYNKISDINYMDTKTNLSNMLVESTTEKIVMDYFNSILRMVKITKNANKNIGNMLNVVIDLIYEIHSKEQLQTSARMPYDVMNALKINGNTWSDYYPAITATLNLIDDRLNTIKTNTTPLSYTQTYNPVNFK